MKKSDNIGFVIFVISILAAWHAYGIVNAKAQLQASDPTFIRIVSTGSVDVRCGRYLSTSNLELYPKGEKFYSHSGQIYNDDNLRKLDAEGNLKWFPDCGSSRYGNFLGETLDIVFLRVL